MHSAPGSAPEGGDGKDGVRENQPVLATWQQMACGRKVREGGGQRREDQSLGPKGCRAHAGCFLTADHLSRMVSTAL